MMKKNDCVFCRIVNGDEYASKIYEDDKILAFMDIRPITEGEFMIIPKEHIDHFFDIPDDLAQHIILYAQRLSRKLKEKLNPLRIGYVVHGFGVAHAHLVIVPLNNREDITSIKFMQIINNKIELNFEKIPLTERKELDRTAKILKENI